MEKQKEKNLELERLVFFSDAIVAIAITLLALDLKIERVSGGHLTFSDILRSWKVFVAFILSFLIIAVFWQVHHKLFSYIKKVDQRLMIYNLGWLLFLVSVPFTTTLVSAHFFDVAAIFFYSLNILLISIFQNLIWDYVAERPEFLKETLTPEMSRFYRVACNIAMINAVLAMGISFLSPLTAFIILLARTLMLTPTTVRYIQGKEIKKGKREQWNERRSGHKRENEQ